MKPLISLTIGIPAFNESKNIVSLLNQILLQNLNGVILDQIIVVSDASTDDTNIKVKAIKNNLITLVVGKKRKGKVYRLNQIFKMANSDVLIQFDADTRLSHKNVVNELVKPFKLKKPADLVMGWHVPTETSTLVGAAAKFGANVWSSALDELGDKSYYYRCVGNIRAFSKNYYKNISIPVSSGEDRLSFLYAMKNNMKVVFAPKALVYFKVSETYSDYIRQMHRFLKTNHLVINYFETEFVKKYTKISSLVLIKQYIKGFSRQPVQAITFMIIHFIPKLMILVNKKPVPVWTIANTTR